MNDSDYSMEQLPPSSIPAEACVLGSMILNRELQQDAIAEVSAEWFFRPPHRIIFETICSMAKAGYPVDLITLKHKLITLNRLDEVGGIEYIVSLIDGVPNTASIEYYASIIRENYAKREIITTGTKMVSDGYDVGVTAVEAAGNAHAGLQAAMTAESEETESMIGEALDSSLAHAEKVATGETTPGLKTGWPMLDTYILNGGLRPAETIVIAAYPSVGKSVGGCDLARAFCKAGNGTLLASAEMSKESLANRIAAAESNVTINTIRNGRMKSFEAMRLNEAAARIRQWPLKILEGSRTIADIAARAKRINAKWDGGLKAVIIDYLQLMLPSDSRDTREMQTGMMARDCKVAATQMGIPWIMMSQLNRSRMTENKPPEMSNLRGSGQIAEHANIVILLHPTNDRKMEPGTPEEGLGYYEIGVYVPKNRDGMTHAGWGDAIKRKLRRFVGRTDPG